MGVKHTIRKHLNGYIVRCRFDGNHGVPKHSVYLNWETGLWDSTIKEFNIFPSKEMANGFLKLRLASEGRWSEIQQAASVLVLDGHKTDEIRIKDCPTLIEAMDKISLVFGMNK